MFWITKNKYKKALEANGLIHDAIAMGVFDKYYKKTNLGNDDFESILLARSLNWAIPRLDYSFENDLAKFENEELQKRLEEDNNQIFFKGLEIINSDLELEKLINFYVAYEIYLVNNLFSKNNEKKYPGIIRMKKFLFQSSEKEPNIESPDFKENYKNLFIKFNNEYGKYGKIIKKETIDSLFSFI